MLWFKVATDFATDPKTERLALRLRDPNAGMYVVRLWAYCARHALTGQLDATPESVAILEKAMGWKRARGELIEALTECGGSSEGEGGEPGFLEATGARYLVHGWEYWNGASIRKSLSDAKKPAGNRMAPAKLPRGSRKNPSREVGGIGDVSPQLPPGQSRSDQIRSLKQAGDPVDRTDKDALAACLPACAESVRESDPGTGGTEATPPVSSSTGSDSRRLLSIDLREIPDETAARARALVETRLGYRLRIAAKGQEELVSRRWTELVRAFTAKDPVNGLENFVGFCGAAAARCVGAQRRRGQAETGPTSLAYFLGPITDVLTVVDVPVKRYPSTLETSTAGCPAWERLSSHLRAHLRADLFERWFAPLSPAIVGQDLILFAPDPFFAAFLSDNYAAWLVELGRDIAQVEGLIRIDVSQPPAKATGGAP